MDLTAEIVRAVGLAADPAAVTGHGDGALPSAFAVTDLAVASIGVAALAAAALTGKAETVAVDRRLASGWFGFSLRPIGWEMAAAWDPIAGDYRTADGWIRLHTNAPHHRRAAEAVLGAWSDRAGMASAVSAWASAELENAVVAAGGCAAEMRSVAAWAAHPQGQAVAAEPLIHLDPADGGPAPRWAPPADRPLQGVRVLDLTRVLAGPVATRFLAGLGAEVLRIDPPDWDEPGVIPEVTLGKRCARLDLRSSEDRAVFERLLAGADVLVHGYRDGALDGLGYDAHARRRLSPGLIDVSLNAYGWTGPWRSRRGFDSLLQMSSGIADAGMAWKGADKPTPLPVQALDHATGYLMAAAVLAGLRRRRDEGEAVVARMSLARTAKLLVDAGQGGAAPPFAPETPEDLSTGVETTSWGPARRLKPPVDIPGTPLRWPLGARALGSDPPQWDQA